MNARLAQRLHDALDAGDFHAARIIADDMECPEVIAEEMVRICEDRATNPLFGRHLLGNLRKAWIALRNE